MLNAELLLPATIAAAATWLWVRDPVASRLTRRRPEAQRRSSSMGHWSRPSPTSVGSHASDVAELCHALAVELRSGHSPAQAWDVVLTSWDGPLPASPLLSSALPGLQIADAQQRWAAAPGWGALRALSACWRLADETGSGLADALDRLAMALRHEHEVLTEIHGQLATVRATGVLLATLPLLALALGHLLGAEPLRLLFGSWLGLVCALLGAILALAGWRWIHHQVAAVASTLRW